MKKIDNWEAVKVSNGYSRLPAGGYIVEIKDVKDVHEKEYLEIYFDIVKGNEKGYFQKQYDNDTRKDKKWPNAGILRRSYSDNSVSFFKGFITAVEKSNSGYKWDWKESSLKNKLLGVIIGNEEYLNSNGQKRISSKVVSVRSTDIIKSGDFTIPELKTLDATKVSTNNGPNHQATPDFKTALSASAMFGDDDNVSSVNGVLDNDDSEDAPWA